MYWKNTSLLCALLLIVVSLCGLPKPAKSSEITLNEYGTVFDVVDVDKKNLFSIEWSGQRFEEGIHNDLALDDYEPVPVIMKTGQNEEYACYIPNKRKFEEEKTSIINPNPYYLLAKSFKDSMISPCSYRLESYWTYEVCHGRYIRQYHENKENPENPQLQEFMLGKFDKEAFAEAELAYEENKDKFNPPMKRIEGINFPYIEANMTGGTLCDLNKKPRRAVVKYICYPEGLNHLYSLQETVTCEYEIVILTPVLCKHSAFRVKNTAESNVKCYPGENSYKKPKSLRLLEIQSAKDKLSSAKLKLKVAGLDAIDDDEESQNTDGFNDVKAPDQTVHDANRVKVSVNINLKNVPQQTPQTEAGNARPPPYPQDDETLRQDFLSGTFCLIGGTERKYRFCFQKQVELFYKDEVSSRINTITLGTWNGQKTEFSEATEELISQYDNGDICDETGKPRQVSVCLRCIKMKNNLNYVSMVLYEPKTCQYVLKVESPILCTLMADRIDGRNPVKPAT